MAAVALGTLGDGGQHGGGAVGTGGTMAWLMYECGGEGVVMGGVDKYQCSMR